MEQIYSVGDTVVIKDAEFLENHSEERPTVVTGMLHLAGKIVRISSYYEGFVHLEDLDGENVGYLWNENWLEPVCSMDDSIEEAFDELFE